MTNKTLNLWKKFEWRKASEIYPEGFQIFDDEPIKHSDIKQGLLGTCYFISAIVSTISHLNRITDLFITKSVNISGIYAVKFIINGKLEVITVDDYFPVDIKTDLPAFTRSTKNLIWPLILEKAWAKLNGSFENIMYGYPHDVLSFLIPGPSLWINMKNMEYSIEQLWKIMTQEFWNNHIIWGITHKTENWANLKKSGLVPNHCYSIIEWVHFSTKEEGEIQLVKLHNPWGKFEWKGPWHNKDKRWKKFLLRSTGWNIWTPGLFYMPFKLYVKYFRTTTITKNEPEYQLESFYLKTHEKYAVLEINLESNSHVYLNVNQINPRLLWSQIKDSQSSPWNIMIAKVQTPDFFLVYVDGKFWHERELFWDSKQRLQKGKYLIFIEIEWNEGTKCTDYYLSCYGENHIKIKDVTLKYKKEEIIKKMLISCAERKTEAYIYSQETETSEKGLTKIDLKRQMSVEDTGWDYGYILYSNKSTSTVLKEELNFGSMVGYTVENNENTPKIKVNIEPKTKKLILLKRNSDYPKFSVGFKSKILQDTEDLLKHVESKGKKHIVKTGWKEFNIFFYILEHPNGYIFQYHNNEKNLEFEATFSFSLKNLKITEEKSSVKRRKTWGKSKPSHPTSWVIKLKPGESIVRRLEIINDYNKIAYKYNYSFKTIDNSISQEISTVSLKSIIKSKGTKYPLVMGAKIHYYIYDQVKGTYYFMFVNQDKKTLKWEAQFELQNMKLEGPHGPDNVWQIILKPGQSVIKIVNKVKQREEWSLCPSFSYQLSE